VSRNGDDWFYEGIKSIESDPQKLPVTPEYGSAPHITQQRK
jgi:hypothetical protein